MVESNNSPFIPILSFNHPALVELDERVRAKLEKKPTSLNRELQIRSLVYINFNKYLTLLLARAGGEVTREVLDGLNETDDSERFDLVATALKQNKQDIINNFIKIWES